jgi:16S rRNA (cytosine967-C5)-methyltransferase
VKVGGRLVYATCSVLLEENDHQIDKFLAEHDGFRLIPLAEAWTLPSPLPGHGPYLSLTPRTHHTDGFFTAVLERMK